MKNKNTFLTIGIYGLGISFVLNVVMYFLIGNSNYVMVSLWTPIYINFCVLCATWPAPDPQIQVIAS